MFGFADLGVTLAFLLSSRAPRSASSTASSAGTRRTRPCPPRSTPRASPRSTMSRESAVNLPALDGGRRSSTSRWSPASAGSATGNTQSAADYLVGGRQIHPVLMALAYGSTFISTSAIVGFGGVAALFGMGLLWLTALNIFVGIFIAFVVFGRPTRRLGRRARRAHLPRAARAPLPLALHPGLRRRHDRAAHAALRGGGADRRRALPRGPAQARLRPRALVFAVITGRTCSSAGSRAWSTPTPSRAALMFVGMVFLLVVTYSKTGGAGAHQALTELADKVPGGAAEGGAPRLDRHARGSARRIWWQLVSTIVLGVGIGVLAQPQLTLRFMTVKSGKELNRALVPGGIFILFMTGVAFVVGALTNVYFWNGAGEDRARHGDRPGHRQAEHRQGHPDLHPAAMPEWFGYLFMLTLLAAAMSTLSAQFHAIGTAIGRDLYQEAIAGGRHQERTVPIAKVGILVGFVATVVAGLPARRRHRRHRHRALLRHVRGRVPAGLRGGAVLEAGDPGRAPSRACWPGFASGRSGCCSSTRRSRRRWASRGSSSASRACSRAPSGRWSTPSSSRCRSRRW